MGCDGGTGPGNGMGEEGGGMSLVPNTVPALTTLTFRKVQTGDRIFHRTDEVWMVTRKEQGSVFLQTPWGGAEIVIGKREFDRRMYRLLSKEEK